MLGKLLAFVFSFFAVIAAVPLIVVIAVFLFKFDLRSFMNLHPLGSALIAAGYAFIWVMSFFALQDYFIVWKPDPRVASIGKTELIDKLERSFKRTFDGKALFDVFRSDDGRVAITWSSSINYFQIVSGGQIGKKRVVVLTFDEKKHDVYFLMKEKDWRWSLSTNRFDFSMNYSSGISAEISTDIVPSVTMDKDGGFSIDVKKLSYDFRDLWLPIENTLLANGWIIRGGMLPQLSHRLALAVPLALLLFLIFYIPFRGGVSSTAQTKAKTPEYQTQAVDRETYDKNESAQIAVSGKLMSASNIEPILDGFMNLPRKYFEDYKSAFIAYAKVYMEKTDRNPEFVDRINKFAKENEIYL
ncbi:MAG: hypothetical protein FD159_332 [Syntrophaceae bacterium]|nr:MAG: hypothetical protein FD159_332 [Syntrophaceae bacterium]